MKGLLLCAVFLLIFQGLADHNETHPSIYGVRWFLGNHFAYSQSDSSDNTEYFVLMFNSDTPLDGQTNVLIQKNRFPCTQQALSIKEQTIHHPEQSNKTQNDDTNGLIEKTVLHKCVIGDIRQILKQVNQRVVNYSIVLDNLYITQTPYVNIDKYSHLILFHGLFRLPYYEQSFQAVALGDWGEIKKQGLEKGYVDVLPCLLSKIKQNKDIIMVMFTGDMAYDLQGPKYYSMLRYLQPLTSQLVFVATPGNHDTLYHQDTFVLYTKSFYTPQWRDYFNYFNKIKLGNLLFISYNPQLQAYDSKKSDRLKTKLTSIFEQEFTPQVIESIKSKYFPIVFSHYPIYCSQIYHQVQSCQNYERQFKTYRQYFNKIDMKLYISGHMHYYERTRPICYNQTVLPESSTHDMSCPIYVIEGAGGNNDYLQMDYTYPIKNHTVKIVSNSGFGILTVKSQSQNSYPDSVVFEHISAKECDVADHFQMFNPVKMNNQNPKNESTLTALLAKIIIFFLIIVTVIFLGRYIQRTYKSKNALIKTAQSNQNGHVEMVQQNFQAPSSGKGQQNRTS